MNDDSVKFASVTITIRCGDQETIYNLPKVKNPMTEVEYEDYPIIRPVYPKVISESTMKSFSISMKPYQVNGTFYTIMNINHATEVET